MKEIEVESVLASLITRKSSSYNRIYSRGWVAWDPNYKIPYF
jgi:hypothetical protein